MEEKINIYWAFSALEMLAELHEYLSGNSEQTADKYIDGIYKSIKKLEKHPESCGPCINQKLREKKYRCCKYKNHIIIYKFDQQTNKVNILAVIHSKRNPNNLIDIVEGK